MAFSILDVAILTILIISAWVGYRRGLLETSGRIAGIIVGIILAMALSQELSLYLEKQFGLVTQIAEFLGRESLPSLSHSPQFLDPIQTTLGNPASNMALKTVEILGFILIFIISATLVQMLFRAVENLLGRGLLSGLNRILGLGINVVKNFLILTALVGLLASPVRLAARMDLGGAQAADQALKNSVLATEMIKAFSWLQGQFETQV
jgi:uncharacterized membrane protein required for colicin V production